VLKAQEIKMVEKTKNIENETWVFQGKIFKHCPKCEKGIPADFTSHKCGWGLTQEQMDEFHIGDKYIVDKAKVSFKAIPEEHIEDKENKFWTNKVEVFTAITPEKLGTTLNEFFEGRFVIATQTYPYELKGQRVYDAIVYYKVKEVN
jgi:hypothetical protein